MAAPIFASFINDTAAPEHVDDEATAAVDSDIESVLRHETLRAQSATAAEDESIHRRATRKYGVVPSR